MARRAGTGRKDENVEYAECHRTVYGEGIVSANLIGQDPYVWMNDAILHHVFRCEQIRAQERYQADHAAFIAGHEWRSPDQRDPKYQVTRARPEITRPSGQKQAIPGPRPKV